MNDDLVRQAEEFAQSKIGDEIAHDYSHLDRVRKWALKIATGEKYENLALVEIAALFHDIGLQYVENRKDHADKGAEMAEDFLRESGLSQNEINEIIHAVKYHDKFNSTEEKTDLLKIIMDADTLEILGAVGIMRGLTSKYDKKYWDEAIILGETWGLSSSDFDERFKEGKGIGETIVDQLNFQISCADLLQTETAKEIAKPMIEIMKKYLLQLNEEV